MPVQALRRVTAGLRTLPFAIRLVDASHWDALGCPMCRARDGHTPYCLATMLARDGREAIHSIPSPDCAQNMDVLPLNPRG
jgi:hypothetical protein